MFNVFVGLCIRNIRHRNEKHEYHMFEASCISIFKNKEHIQERYHPRRQLFVQWISFKNSAVRSSVTSIFFLEFVFRMFFHTLSGHPTFITVYKQMYERICIYMQAYVRAEHVMLKICIIYLQSTLGSIPLVFLQLHWTLNDSLRRMVHRAGFHSSSPTCIVRWW